MKYTLFIPGKPFGKQRHRNAGAHRTYTPKQTVAYENRLAIEWIKKYGSNPIDIDCRGSVGFTVDVYCCFLPPKSATKSKRELMLKGKILYTKKPDRDNVEKIVGDGLNSIAWIDDSSIVMGEAVKVYMPYQCVKIVVTPITEISKDRLEFIDGIGMEETDE